ncbi:MAG: ATP-binding protein [Actinomycetota bacterium]|nr:ATP-binding protein [Actinomycetota bacterium]
MTIFNKPADEINSDDIINLVNERTAERYNLEYKEAAYGSSDDDTREMLRDISAMANAYGGYLILGIREDRETGEAVEIVNIENADLHRDKIISACLSSIEPRIPGLNARTVEVEGKKVLVIRIPRSLQAPHMVLYKGLYQFWIRHDRQKSKMSVDEIRDAFLRVESFTKQIDSFLREQKQAARNSSQGKALYVIGAAPVILDDATVDITDSQIREIITTPPVRRTNGWYLNFDEYSARPKPFLHGLKISIDNYMQVLLFRNGYLEARIYIDEILDNTANVGGINGQSSPIINAYALIEFTVIFFIELKSLYSYLGVEGPYATYLSLYNINGYGIKENPEQRPRPFSVQKWEDDDLEIAPLQINSVQDPDANAKYFMDRVWQAFGFEEAPLFENGEFTPRS